MSKENYIIICSGETAVRAAQNPSDMICYASECAAELLKHLAITRPGEVTQEEYAAVSRLQHTMMDVVENVNRSYAKELCAQMFELLVGIERRLNEAPS